MNISIFKARLKRYLPLFFVILTVLLVAVFIQFISDLVSFSLSYAPYFGTVDKISYRLVDSNIHTLFMMACIIAMFIPIEAFQYRYSRTSGDIVYSLPVRRKTMIFIEMLASYIQVAAAYTISYLVFVILSLTRIHDGVFYPGYLLFYFAALITLGLYLIAGATVALISRSSLEAVLIHIFLNVPFFVFNFSLTSLSFDLNYYLPLLAANYIVSIFNPMIGYAVNLNEGTHSINYSLINGMHYCLGSFICLIIIAACVVPVIFFVTERQKSEDSGNANKSFVGIRTILPAGFLLMSVGIGLILGDAQSPSLIIIGCLGTLIAHLVLDMIARKRIKLTKDLGIGLLIDLVAILVPAIIITLKKTGAFSPVTESLLLFNLI